MYQWEIYTFPQPDAANAHPCVVLSPDRLANNPGAPAVNVLACTSLRPADRYKPETEIVLNEDDGLDGPTILICSFILAFKKEQVIGLRRGEVGRLRQQALKNLLAKLFGIYFK